MLLEELSQPERRHGTLVDGFPRTVVQVSERARGHRRGEG
jgi:adenylate kinase family enzyme